MDVEQNACDGWADNVAQTHICIVHASHESLLISGHLRQQRVNCWPHNGSRYEEQHTNDENEEIIGHEQHRNHTSPG